MNQIIESKSDCPEFRHIFVETFSNEPSFQFMLPNTDTRKKHVAWLVDKKLKLHGDTYLTLTTGGNIKGFAWWIPPGKKKEVSVLEQLKIGFWKGPFKFGCHFRKMLAFGEQESRILKKYLATPHWILDVIAIDPECQRSGIGGALMEPIFQRSKADGIPCFVLTHNPRNVKFYEKYGFKLVLDEPVLGPNSPHAYGLERPV